MNVVNLIGRLGKDPEVNTTNSGIPVCNLSLAVKGYKKDSPPDWIPLTLFNKTAETAGQYLRQGSEIAIEGRIQVRSYDDKKGVKQWRTDVIVNKFHFIGSKDKDADSSSQQSTPANVPAGVGEPNFDDIPF